MDKENENVKDISDYFIDITGMYYGKNGSNDYSRRGIEIDTIIDNLGNAVKKIWEDEWTQIAPGIETATVKGVRTVRIYREACPVRVRFRHYSEYVSYDYHEHNSSWEQFYWVRYERSDKKALGNGKH
ncbi:MAG: hypothetical protein ABIJ59_01925 [Pseudomonadota bacterium]